MRETTLYEPIKLFLAQQGYWKASVTSSTEESPDRRTIVFTVRRGLLYHVGETVGDLLRFTALDVGDEDRAIERVQPARIRDPFAPQWMPSQMRVRHRRPGTCGTGCNETGGYRLAPIQQKLATVGLRKAPLVQAGVFDH